MNIIDPPSTFIKVYVTVDDTSIVYGPPDSTLQAAIVIDELKVSSIYQGHFWLPLNFSANAERLSWLPMSSPIRSAYLSISKCALSTYILPTTVVN